MYFLRFILNPEIDFVKSIYFANSHLVNDDITGDDDVETYHYHLEQDQNTIFESTKNTLIHTNYNYLSGNNSYKILDIMNRTNILEGSRFQGLWLTREQVLDLGQKLEDPWDSCKLAVQTNDEFDLEVFEIYQQALKHPDAFYRRCAVAGIPYTVNWEQFQEPLEQLIKDESDQEVKEFTELVLKTMIKYDWNRRKIPDQ